MLTKTITKKDYKLECSNLETKVKGLEEEIIELKEEVVEIEEEIEDNLSECYEEINDLKARLEPFEGLFPTIRSMGDCRKLERLIKLFPTITDKQLDELGV